jgi:phosphoglycerate dehydrogenase-like enzyme
MKLIVSDEVAARFGDRIRHAAPDAEIVSLNADGSWTGDPAGAEAGYLSVDMLIHRSVPVLIDALPRLRSMKWLHAFLIGLDDPMLRTVLDCGITFTNGAGSQSMPIGQYVLLMMLYHAKRMGDWVQNQRLHRWQRVSSDELTGKTVGLVGAGGIGAEVARLAKALRMRVIATRRRPEPVEHVDELLPADAVGELCARADYLVICAPLTERTRGIVGRGELARMKPTAVLINVARGPLVDQEALIEVLRERRIGGASLDVFDEEPLPPDSPLWDLPNVVITPHCSPSSPMHIVRGTELFIENLGRYARGEALLNLVNPEDVGHGVSTELRR